MVGVTLPASRRMRTAACDLGGGRAVRAGAHGGAAIGVVGWRRERWGQCKPARPPGHQYRPRCGQVADPWVDDPRREQSEPPCCVHRFHRQRRVGHNFKRHAVQTVRPASRPPARTGCADGGNHAPVHRFREPGEAAAHRLSPAARTAYNRDRTAEDPRWPTTPPEPWPPTPTPARPRPATRSPPSRPTVAGPSPPSRSGPGITSAGDRPRRHGRRLPGPRPRPRPRRGGQGAPGASTPPSPVVARRFVEEARITGQLQHPGILPVHELGTLPDGRPFLAMKLVKGRTLADLLDGPDAAADRGRFLRASSSRSARRSPTPTPAA